MDALEWKTLLKWMIRGGNPLFLETPKVNIFDISDHLLCSGGKRWTEVLIIQQGNHHFGFPHLTNGVFDGGTFGPWI